MRCRPRSQEPSGSCADEYPAYRFSSAQFQEGLNERHCVGLSSGVRTVGNELRSAPRPDAIDGVEVSPEDLECFDYLGLFSQWFEGLSHALWAGTKVSDHVHEIIGILVLTPVSE